MNPTQIAEICHEANRALQRVCPVDGIPVAVPWPVFPRDQQLGVIDGVQKALAGATPEELHASWMERKLSEGWTYGEVKDEIAKTHPCLLPYDELPVEQRRKDQLFSGIVNALR